MYTHCIFCKAQLGKNETIERFPIGRRLAFDAAQGRLWVVCRSCNRWNLTPIEERWEAIEECERHYRDTRTRLATEHIGLARVLEGTDLVRIGSPQRPEFAAWRYGRQLLKRRLRSALLVGAAWGIPPGIIVLAFHQTRVVALLIDDTGRSRICKAVNLRNTRLVSESGQWKLCIPHMDGAFDISGARALESAAIITPYLNPFGAGARQVRAAVQEVETAAGLDAYLGQLSRKLEHALASSGSSGNRKYGYLGAAPAPIRLALEMMSHEEQERRALEGELHELEAMWREAEEIASISDNLFLPRGVVEFFRKNKEKQ